MPSGGEGPGDVSVEGPDMGTDVVLDMVSGEGLVVGSGMGLGVVLDMV